MTSTPILQESTPKEPEIRVVAPHSMTASITVGLGIMWMVGIALAWNVVMVLFHDVMARLLS